MDAGGKKKEAALPPGYVSLEMLRQRWLLLERAKKQKGEKEEEEVKRGPSSNEGSQAERVLQNEGDERRPRRGGGLLRDPLRGRVEGGEASAEMKEKGNEVAIVGFDSRDVRKPKVMRKRNRKKKKFQREGRETGDGDKIEDVEIADEELKEVQRRETVSRCGDRGGFRRTGGDTGFRRNSGDKLRHRGGKGYILEPDDGMEKGGVELDLGKNQKADDGGRIITKKEGDDDDDDDDDGGGGGGGGGGASEKEILEVTNRIRDLNTGFTGQKYERGEIWGRRRGRHWSGSFRGGLNSSTSSDWEANRGHVRMEWNAGYGSRARSRMGWNTGYGRGFLNRQNMPGHVWVKKGEKPGDAAEENAI